MRQIVSALRTAGLVAMTALLLACKGGGDGNNGLGGGSSTQTGTYF